jgi:hypothetical protein
VAAAVESYPLDAVASRTNLRWIGDIEQKPLEAVRRHGGESMPVLSMADAGKDGPALAIERERAGVTDAAGSAGDTGSWTL